MENLLKSFPLIKYFVWFQLFPWAELFMFLKVAIIMPLDEKLLDFSYLFVVIINFSDDPYGYIFVNIKFCLLLLHKFRYSF